MMWRSRRAERERELLMEFWSTVKFTRERKKAKKRRNVQRRMGNEE